MKPQRMIESNTYKNQVDNSELLLALKNYHKVRDRLIK